MKREEQNILMGLDTVQHEVCVLIKDLFFGSRSSDKTKRLQQLIFNSETNWHAICDELKKQTIQLLFSDYLIDKDLPGTVMEKWKSDCFDDFEFNIRLLTVLQWLDDLFTENQVPYMVIKGNSAAVLYPRPILRTQGDIDILIAPSHLAEAISTLNEADCEGNHCLEITDTSSLDRDYAYRKDKVLIELHTRFAILNERVEEKTLDRWLYKASEQNTIRKEVFYVTFPAPPDELNGLVLLAHVRQHLEGGLGLRQILDWMMFVYQFLDDDAWPSFRKKASRIGLETLAVTVTRMCQLYLGLPEEKYTWCQNANPELCRDLLDYIFKCGNFGYKQGMSNSAAMVISHGRGVRGFFRNLQKRGEANWELYKKHSWLKPFAWLFQLGRYGKFAIGREGALSKLVKEIRDGRKRGELMDRLGDTNLSRKK